MAVFRNQSLKTQFLLFAFASIFTTGEFVYISIDLLVFPWNNFHSPIYQDENVWQVILLSLLKLKGFTEYFITREAHNLQ